MNKKYIANTLQSFMLRNFISVISILVFLVSCENDLEVVKSFNDPDIIPEYTTEKLETLYFDSARLSAKIEAPLMFRYNLTPPKEPYMEFPKGLHVQIFDSAKNVKAEVKSMYAVYNEVQKIWEARKDVVVISTDGKRLNTEQLFWDQKKKIIYSNKFCRVTTESANFTGNKFQANEDFSWYELTEVQGPIKVKDE